MKKKGIIFILLTLFSLIALLPVYWTAVGAFLDAPTYAAHYASTARTPVWWPVPAVLDQFQQLFTPDMQGTVEYIGEYWISVRMTLVMTAIHIPIAILLGYLLAKVKFRGRQILFFLVILTMLAPLQVTLTPTLIVAREMGIFGSVWGVYLPAFVAPFGIFLMRQFIRTVDDEVLEAARLETESVIVLLCRIIVPMVKPAVLTLGLLTACECWNMVEQPLLMMERAYLEPLALSLNDMNRMNGEYVFAASLLYMVPVLSAYVLLREHFVKSISEMNL